MLVVIDPNVGSPDSNSTKIINMMRAIKAVMTASAGSTPSVVPFASASGVGGNSTSMITVIANTEAGGWSVGSGDTVPTTTYSTSTNYFLDLYVQNTGSATYPYQKFCMTPGDPKIQSNYNFSNSNFNTYPIVSVWHGAHTVANLVTSDAFYNSTTQVPSMYYTSYYTAASGNRSPFNPASGAFMMAVTATYVHFINLSGTSYSSASLTYGTTGIGGYVASFGLRQLQLWESGSAYAGSSPGVCGSWLTCATNNDSVYYPAAAFFWGQRINKDGTILSPIKFVNQNSFGSLTNPQLLNPVTGQSMYSSYTSTYQSNYDVGAARVSGPDYNGYGYRVTTGASVAVPVYLMQSLGYSGNWATPPVSDSSTGALVPPAYPHIYSCAYQDGTYNNMNPGSKMPGIFKSLSAGYPSANYNMLTFVTLNQTYVVDGDNYFPALTGFATGIDLFLLRKA